MPYTSDTPRPCLQIFLPEHGWRSQGKLGQKLKYMVVYVRAVRMCRHNERKLPLGKPHGELMPQTVCFFRCDLPGFKRLPYLIGNHITFLGFPSLLKVQTLLQKEFLIHGHGVTPEGRHQFPFLCLLRILRIIGSCFEAGSDRPALVHMKCDQSCRCHRSRSLRACLRRLPP